MTTTAVATLSTKEARGDGQTSLAFYADYADERNKAWAKYTPALALQMTVTDSVAEQFEKGKRYLLTFEDGEAREIPEGYEPAENSAAKNHAMDALEKELEKQGVEVYTDGDEGGIELITIADAVVEALLAAGVKIPENITDPHGR